MAWKVITRKGACGSYRWSYHWEESQPEPGWKICCQSSWWYKREKKGLQEKQTEKCKKEREAAQIQTEAGRLVEQCPTRTKFWILSSTTNTVFQSPDLLWIESSCVPDTTFTCKPVLLQLLDVWQGVHFEPVSTISIGWWAQSTRQQQLLQRILRNVQYFMPVFVQ